jgi:hypothetical protein
MTSKRLSLDQVASGDVEYVLAEQHTRPDDALVPDTAQRLPFVATAKFVGVTTPVTSYFSKWGHVAPIKVPAAKTALHQ